MLVRGACHLEEIPSGAEIVLLKTGMISSSSGRISVLLGIAFITEGCEAVSVRSISDWGKTSFAFGGRPRFFEGCFRTPLSEVVTLQSRLCRCFPNGTADEVDLGPGILWELLEVL